MPEVTRLADPLAESPLETRIRLAIRFDGPPMPVLQHPVGAYDLDMAYPDVLLAVEYDGREHLTAERARRDLDRQAFRTAADWTVRPTPIMRPAVARSGRSGGGGRCGR